MIKYGSLLCLMIYTGLSFALNAENLLNDIAVQREERRRVLWYGLILGEIKYRSLDKEHENLSNKISSMPYCPGKMALFNEMTALTGPIVRVIFERSDITTQILNSDDFYPHEKWLAVVRYRLK